MGMSCCLSALFLPCGEKKKKELVLPSSPGVSYQGPLSTVNANRALQIVYLALQILGFRHPALRSEEPGRASPAVYTNA